MLGTANTEPGVRARRRMGGVAGSCVLCSFSGLVSRETTAPSSPVFSEILTWRRSGDLKRQREKLKPEGQGSRAEKRREWGVLSGRVCGIWSKFMCSWFRERRECL